jgi:hypothetical protein
MKTVLIIAGVAALTAAAVLWTCAKGIGQIAREEDQQIRHQIEDDRLTCGLIEEG